MARSFMRLFCRFLFVLCQIVVSNTAGNCLDGESPAVELCNSNSDSAPIVYIDAFYVPTFENITCRCTLNIENGQKNDFMRVRRLRRYTSDIDIFINNTKVLVSQNVHRFSYTAGMEIVFKMSDTQDKLQCYKFEKVAETESTIHITCTRWTVNPGISESTTTSATEATPSVVPETSTSENTEPSNTNTAEKTSPGAKDTGTSRDTSGAEPNKINIGVIAGAAGGGLAVVVVVVIIMVVLCKRRGASEKARKQDASDIHNEEPEYSLTTNAGYVSADDCHRETDNATEHDPRGYTLVNKPRPKQQRTQQNAVDEDNYNHLNDVFHTHNPANVYNTRTEATAESDIDAYNRLNEFRKPNETDNVYNVASSNTNQSNEYDRANVPTRNGPEDYEYSTTNKVYKP